MIRRLPGRFAYNRNVQASSDDFSNTPECSPLRRELISMACAYLDACSARAPVRAAGVTGYADEAKYGVKPVDRTITSSAVL
jgi:hypothetical protein